MSDVLSALEKLNDMTPTQRLKMHDYWSRVSSILQEGRRCSNLSDWSIKLVDSRDTNLWQQELESLKSSMLESSESGTHIPLGKGQLGKITGTDGSSGIPVKGNGTATTTVSTKGGRSHET
jgi:hypothetical protein